MKMSISVLIIIIICTMQSFAKDAKSILEENRQALVSIWSLEKIDCISYDGLNDKFNFDTLTLSGSGFFVSEDGVVVTNLHVVDYLDQIMVKTYDSMFYPAEIITVDIKNDLVLLKLSYTYGNIFSKVKLADSDDIIVGEDCFAIGSPFGFEYTISKGIISGIRLNQEIEYTKQDIKFFDKVIQTDAAIAPGNSGGALFNKLGDVIGLTTYTEGRGSNDSYGNLIFAVEIGSVKRLITKDSINIESIKGQLECRIQKNQFNKQKYFKDIILIKIRNNVELIEKHDSTNLSFNISLSNSDSLYKIYLYNANKIIRNSIVSYPDSIEFYDALVNYLIITQNNTSLDSLLETSNIFQAISNQNNRSIFDNIYEYAVELKGELNYNKSKDIRPAQKNNKTSYSYNTHRNLNYSKGLLFKCLTLKPGNKEVIRNILDLLIQTGNFENTNSFIDSIKSCFISEMEFKDFIKQIIGNYVRKSDYSKAIFAIEKICEHLKIKDEEVEFMKNLCFLSKNKKEKALTHLFELTERYPNLPWPYFEIGFQYFQIYEKVSSRKYLLKALCLYLTEQNCKIPDWYAISIDDVYNKLFEIAIIQNNKDEAMIYFNLLHSSKSDSSRLDCLSILKLIK